MPQGHIRKKELATSPGPCSSDRAQGHLGDKDVVEDMAVEQTPHNSQRPTLLDPEESHKGLVPTLAYFLNPDTHTEVAQPFYYLASPLPRGTDSLPGIEIRRLLSSQAV